MAEVKIIHDSMMFFSQWGVQKGGEGMQFIE